MRHWHRVKNVLQWFGSMRAVSDADIFSYFELLLTVFKIWCLETEFFCWSQLCIGIKLISCFYFFCFWVWKINKKKFLCTSCSDLYCRPSKTFREKLVLFLRNLGTVHTFPKLITHAAAVSIWASPWRPRWCRGPTPGSPTGLEFSGKEKRRT